MRLRPNWWKPKPKLNLKLYSWSWSWSVCTKYWCAVAAGSGHAGAVRHMRKCRVKHVCVCALTLDICKLKFTSEYWRIWKAFYDRLLIYHRAAVRIIASALRPGTPNSQKYKNACVPGKLLQTYVVPVHVLWCMCVLMCIYML